MFSQMTFSMILVTIVSLIRILDGLTLHRHEELQKDIDIESIYERSIGDDDLEEKWGNVNEFDKIKETPRKGVEYDNDAEDAFQIEYDPKKRRRKDAEIQDDWLRSIDDDALKETSRQDGEYETNADDIFQNMHKKRTNAGNWFTRITSCIRGWLPVCRARLIQGKLKMICEFKTLATCN